MRHGLGFHNRHSAFGFQPISLYTGGVAGAWYDPSDYGASGTGGVGTLFQDSAGTTPVTGVEQVVGRMLDKSGNGYHATATGTARPTLSARVNLLTKTEQFDDAVWIKAAGGVGVLPVVTANAGTAPDGTLTADRIQFDCGNTTSATNRSRVQQAVTLVNGQAHNGRIWLKAYDAGNVGKTIRLVIESNSNEIIHTLTADWDLVLLPGTATSTSGNFLFETRGLYTQQTADVLVWGSDFRVTNDGVNIPPYQRVNTATDYDTAGFPLYLSFAGAQAMSTPANIDFATVTSDGQARRNLLSNPNQFDAAGWTKTDATVVANAGVAPDGTSTADLIYPTTTGTIRGAYQAFTASAIAYTGSLYFKAAGKNAIRLVEFPGSLIAVSVDLTTGVVSGVLAGYTVSTVNEGSGWWRVVYTATPTAGTRYVQFMVTDNVSTSTATTNGTDGVLVWGAQLETGSTATAFQNIGTDKMLVCAGVRKLSDANVALLAELSASLAANNGSFWIGAPIGGGIGNYEFRSKGTTDQAATTPASFSAPITNVFTGTGNIGGSVAQVRINGSVSATNTNSQGTGNFGTYPLYIGARNLASFFFTGRIYGLIVAGSQYTSGQVSATEAYMNTKTRAYA